MAVVLIMAANNFLGKILFVISLSTLLCNQVYLQIFTQPEQVHLSIGASTSEIVITWVTFSPTNDSVVEYTTDGKKFVSVIGTQDLYVDGGSEKRNIYMHRVSISKLVPLQKYQYRVGSRFGWTSLYSFRALSTDSKWSPRFAVFGDMGNKNARSLAALQLEAESGAYDMILHVGDFAYNMDSDNARYGDEFMRQIEPVASMIPYMTCAGNHEAAYNFSNYRRRFTMPGGDGQAQYYSFNVGPAHIIAISTEFYYFTSYGWKQIMNQFNWLEKDLQEANLPANRAKRPWIIVMGHRPMYCSNNNDPMHCTTVDNLVRVGVPYTTPYAKTIYLFRMEDLFYKNGVDLIFGAHEHSYERLWPVYNRKVCNGTSAPYTNPPAPVHIVTGSAGCQEGPDPFIPNGQPWSAFRSDDYGYTRMNILNGTHLYLEQVSDDKDGKVVDKMEYIRTKHGPGLFNCT